MQISSFLSGDYRITKISVESERLDDVLSDLIWTCKNVFDFMPTVHRYRDKYFTVKLPSNLEVMDTIYGIDIIDSDSYESEENFSRIISHALVLY